MKHALMALQAVAEEVRQDLKYADEEVSVLHDDVVRLTDELKETEVELVRAGQNQVAQRSKLAEIERELEDLRTQAADREPPPKSQTDTVEIVKWLAGRDTGLSSQAIATATIAGRVVSTDYPHDSGDFGRCYRLLKAHPCCEEGIALLEKDGGPVWAALIEAWGRLELLYEEVIASLQEGCPPFKKPTPERAQYEAAQRAFSVAIKDVIAGAGRKQGEGIEDDAQYRAWVDDRPVTECGKNHYNTWAYDGQTVRGSDLREAMVAFPDRSWRWEKVVPVHTDETGRDAKGRFMRGSGRAFERDGDPALSLVTDAPRGDAPLDPGSLMSDAVTGAASE